MGAPLSASLPERIEPRRRDNTRGEKRRWRCRTIFTSTPLCATSSTASPPSAACFGTGARFSSFSGLSGAPLRLRKYRQSLLTGPSGPFPAKIEPCDRGVSRMAVLLAEEMTSRGCSTVHMQ